MTTIKIKLFNTQIGADFTFLAVVAMFLTLDTTGFALMSLAVCLIHETGHLAAMIITGRKPDSILFRAGGVKISAATGSDSVFVLIAGSAVNIGLFLALYFTLPKTDINPVMFAVLNLVIGVFNLLPIGCLDGSRLLALIIPEKPLKVIRVLSVIAVTVAIAAGLMRGGVNFTLAAAMIYIISMDIFS